MKKKHEKMYMDIAHCCANTSVGVRLKVGAVIVKDNNIISTGYNGLPAHIDGMLEDDSGNTRPEVRHAEKNALMALTKSNESSVGATMFCTHSCCYLCSVDIIDAGIVKFVYENEYRSIEGIDNLIKNGVIVEKWHNNHNTTFRFSTSKPESACDGQCGQEYETHNGCCNRCS